MIKRKSPRKKSKQNKSTDGTAKKNKSPKGEKSVKKYKRKKYVPLPKSKAPYSSTKRNNTPKKQQVCSNKQAKIDQRLFKPFTKGLEALTRKQLQKVSKKHKIKTFQRKSKDIIKELRTIAKGLE